MKRHVKRENKVKQLQSVKVFNAVKCGADELMFLQDKDFILELEGMFVHIKNRKTGSKVATPITNTPWMVFKEIQDNTPKEVTSEQTTSLKDIGGAKQEKNKRSKVAKPQLP